MLAPLPPDYFDDLDLSELQFLSPLSAEDLSSVQPFVPNNHVAPIEPLPASTLIPNTVSKPLTPHYLVQPRCERSSPSIGNSSPYSSPRSDRSSQFINSFNHYAQHYQQPLTHPLPPVPAMASTHSQESEQYADQLKFIKFIENLLEQGVSYYAVEFFSLTQ
jgi:hypothetical protein